MAQAAAKTKKIFDGRYEVLSIVGRGGRSVVYHARTINPPYTEVALKVLLEQKGKSSTGERLRKEALALVSSRHRYVIRLDDFHSVGSLCYLSMEYAPEADLRRYLVKLGGKIEVPVAERYLLQISEALSFVHKAGIIHRDVKPDNILVANAQEVRLGDFGVAVLPGEGATLEELQAGVGTMNYLAPEVLEGKGSDQRADLYALGVSFYEMLAGRNPFENASMLQQMEVREDKNIPTLSSLRSDVPDYLSAAIQKAMSFDPLKRFDSVREFTQSLLMGKAAANNPIKAAMKIPPTDTHTTARPAKDVADTIVVPPGTSPETIVESAPAVATKPDAVLTTTPSSELSAQEPNSEEPGHTQAVPAAAVSSSSGSKALGVSQTVVAPPMSKEALKKIADAVGDPAPAPVEMTATTFVPREAIDEARRGRKGSGRRFPKSGNKKPVPHEVELEKPSKARLVAMLGLTMGALVILVPGVIGAVRKWLPVAQPVEATQGVIAASQSPIPQFTATELQFPHLPGGLYTGSISELMPGKTLPLSIISLESKDQLIFIVGLEGWTPVTVSPRAQTNGNASASIRVASSGFILEVTGQALEGEVFGYFKNIATGAQGEWRARPFRSSGS